MRIYIIIACVAAMAAVFWQQHSELTATRAALKTATTDLATCGAVRDSVEAAAAACSRATEEAATLAAERAKRAQAAVEAAQAGERVATQRANALLKRRPSDPTDLCRSADEMLTDWIKQRAKP